MKTLLNLLTIVFFPRKSRGDTTPEPKSSAPPNAPEEKKGTKRKPTWKRRFQRLLRALGVTAALTASTVVPWTPSIGAQVPVVEETATAQTVSTTATASASGEEKAAPQAVPFTTTNGFKPERVQIRRELVLSFEVTARTNVETEWGTFWNVTFRPKSLSFQPGVFSPAGREDFTLKYLTHEAAQNLVPGTTIHVAFYASEPNADSGTR